MYVTQYDEFMKRNGFEKSFPQRLYHYTNSEASINIFENGEFWLTHVKYFNDRKEYYDGVNLILSELSKRSGELGDALHEALRGIFLNEQWIDKPLTVAILSFSTQRDLLSQWRGYTKLGLGICLGFNTMQLYSQEIKAHLRPCIYSRHKKVEIVNRIIDELMYKKVNEDKTIDQISNEAFWLFQESAITFKSEAFQEEDEWRLITFPYAINAKEWNFRTGSSTIIPFVKQNIDLKSCLEEVIVGPSENQELTKNSLFYLMFKK
ncbi:MAG: hypothetical protein CVU66_02630, partial [Deltaproteobacteria bacterium HGW-Deltaproteobacteria-23]